MTPETSLFLAKARRMLEEADGILAIKFNEAAGRAAYLAGFHAAQALISERTGRSVKTHKGVQIEFYKLTKDDVRIDARAQTFLNRTYDLKTLADYETGPGSEVSPEQAAQAIGEAKQLVAKVSEMLERPDIDAERKPDVR